MTLNNLLGRADYAALKAALLRGYQRIRPLPKDYERYLNSLIGLRSLQKAHWPLTMSPTSPLRTRLWSEVEQGLAEVQQYVAKC